MTEQEILLKALNTAIWELGEAFTDFPDEEFWKRPHARLLSAGEIATHIAFWEANSFDKSFDTPLKNAAGEYYNSNVDAPFELSLGAKDLYAEIKRIHEACISTMSAHSHDLDSGNPNREGWTWRTTLEYQAFHIAYHTGQIYSVRHMFGHQTVDN